MTQVRFLHGAGDRIQAAAAWLAIAAAQGRQVLVFVPQPARAEQLDRTLWTQPATGFVAHCRADDPLAAETPIVLAGNLMDAPKRLPAGQDRRFVSFAISKFAAALGHSASELELEVVALQHEMDRINHPSKNTVYAMSKAIFHKYDLFRYQDPYFRSLKAPNPIVLKRLNQLMAFCLWDWAAVLDEWKVTQ